MQVTYRKQTWTFEEGMTIQQLLARLELLRESVLVLRNGELVTEDRYVAATDEVTIIAVMSGG